MSLATQATLLMFGAPALWLGVLFWLIARRWVFRAGLISGVAAFLPLIWQWAIGDSDAPGFAFLVIPMFAISLLTSAVGLVLITIRKVQKMHQNRS